MPPLRRSRALAIVTGIVLTVVLAGCGPLEPRPLSPEDMSKITSRSYPLVLLRVVGRDQDRAPFDLMANNGDFKIGIGGFESGGVPDINAARGPRALSQAARDEGWIVLILRPGYQYLTFAQPGASRADLESYRRWRIAVPPGAQVIYAGTFHFSAMTGVRGFEPHRVLGFDQDATSVEDETPLAIQTARRDLPSLPSPITRLAVRQTGPILLDMPPPVPWP